MSRNRWEASGSCTSVADFSFAVGTNHLLLFFSCFINSDERRRSGRASTLLRAALWPAHTEETPPHTIGKLRRRSPVA